MLEDRGETMKTNPNLTLIAYGMTGDFLSSLAFQAVNQVKTKLSQSLKVNQIQVLSETEAYRNWGFLELPVTVLYWEDQPLLEMAGFQSAHSLIFQITEFLKRRDF
jgi:hypothetical protein